MATTNIDVSWSVVRRWMLMMALATAVVAAASSPRQLETINNSNINNRRRQSAVRGQNQHLTINDLDSHRALGVGHGGGGGGGKDKPSSKGSRGGGRGKSSGDGHGPGKNEKDDKDDKNDKEEDDDDDDDDDEGEKGTKLNGGKTSGGGKDRSGKKGGSKSGGGNKKGKKGDDDEDKPETFRRTVPAIKLSYEIEGPLKRSKPGIGDYNELSVTTEYFFDSFFRSVFEDLPVSLDATIVHIMLEDNEDPFFVDFMVGLDFVVPGEVPTLPFLLDWVEESFERPTSMNSYISDLQAMAEANPFSDTKSVSIVRNSPDNAVGFSDGPGGPWKDPRTKNKASENKMFMIGLISGIALVVFILVGLLWVRQRRSSRVVVENDGKSTPDSDSESDADELHHLNVTMGSSPTKNDSTQRSSSQEEDAVKYLDSVRKRYREEEDEQKVKTAFDGVLIPEETNRDSGLPSKPSLDEESDTNYSENVRLYSDNHQYHDHDDGRGGGGGGDDFYDECGSVESYESGSVYEEEVVEEEEEEEEDETPNERGTTASIFRV